MLDTIRIRVRKWIRRQLGIAAIQRQIRDLEDWKNTMGVSREDLERLNAATSRIAARVNSLLDQIEALGTGNDDEVRQQAQLESIQQASVDLRPVIEQLEALGANAEQPVPTPSPEQVPVEPGPDVTPVENLPDAGTPVEETPVDSAPVEEAPATEPVTGGEDAGTVVTDAPPAGGDTAPGPDESENR